MPASNFLEQLPIEFFLCGYKVRISRADGLIRMGISDKPISVSTRKDWEKLAISASPNRIREFLTFYLKTPVGPSVLTFGPFSDINRRRCHIVTLTLAAWRSRNGTKDKAGVRLLPKSHKKSQLGGGVVPGVVPRRLEHTSFFEPQ
jgi:hypothetical protein